MHEYIKETLPTPELLAQLAEEAAELGHAALKLRRVYDGTNPTPTNLLNALAVWLHANHPETGADRAGPCGAFHARNAAGIYRVVQDRRRAAIPERRTKI